MEEVRRELEEYPSLTPILNDFVSNVLLHKPDDVYSFANSYFTTFHSTVQNKPLPVVVAGPSGVGKGTRLRLHLLFN